jgi:hypothetical protein
MAMPDGKGRGGGHGNRYEPLFTLCEEAAFFVPKIGKMKGLRNLSQKVAGDCLGLPIKRFTNTRL